MKRLKLIKQHGLEEHQILIESDSQVLVQMVLRKVMVPWRLQIFLEQIWQLLDSLQYQMRHIYREANGVADFLASFAVQSEAYIEFSAQGTLPLSGRLLLQQDQSGLPTARRKRVVIKA